MATNNGYFIGTTKNGISVFLIPTIANPYGHPNGLKKHINNFNKGLYKNGFRFKFLNKKGAKIQAFNQPLFVHPNTYILPNNSSNMNYYARNRTWWSGQVKGISHQKRNEKRVREVLGKLTK
jgi:hypothetical protein